MKKALKEKLKAKKPKKKVFLTFKLDLCNDTPGARGVFEAREAF